MEKLIFNSCFAYLYFPFFRFSLFVPRFVSLFLIRDLLAID